MESESSINITWSAIFKILLAIIVIYILYLVQNIVIWLIFAFIIGILFNFPIDYLESKKIPRVIGAILIYLAVFSLLGFFVYKTAPLFLSEISDFVKNFPSHLEKASPLLEKFGLGAIKANQSSFDIIMDYLQKAGKGFFNSIFVIFGSVTSTVFILFLAFFISLERNLGGRIILMLSPEKHKEYFKNLWERSKQKVSGWFLSRIAGVIFVGLSTFIVLKILNVDYSLTLGLAAGIFDFIPILGPFAIGLIITLLVYLNSTTQAVFVLIAFVIIQILENDLVLPIIYRKVVDMSPVVVLVALAVGGKLWGILGAILSIPLAAIIFEILKDYLKSREKGSSAQTEQFGANSDIYL